MSFREGSSSGAITNNGQSFMLISNADFNGNVSGGAAGAVENTVSSVLLIFDSGFYGNQGESGGAVANSSYGSGGSVIIRNSEFRENFATALAGALFNEETSSKMAVLGSLFSGNYANLAGGAVSNFGTLAFYGSNVFSGNYNVIEQGGTGGGGAVDNRGVLDFWGPASFAGNRGLSRGGGAIHNITILPEDAPIAGA